MRSFDRRALDAQSIAIRALGFIAGDAERLGRFLSLTGIGPETLRQSAAEPHFLASVLDFLAEDEGAVLAFAANEGLRPDMVQAARQALAGHAADDF